MVENGDVKTKFPMPFFLMVAGYTLILIIDKVLFDTHVIFDDHGDDGHEHNERRGSMMLK